MSHSLIGADRRTHCKIVLVALVGAVGLAVAAGAARPAAERGAAKSVVHVVKAAKPAMVVAQVGR